MGCGATKEEIDKQIEASVAQFKADDQHEELALKSLDDKTRVGHLLIELRNLGFVELQGKDIGGIYARLDEWLTRNWRAKRTDKDLVLVTKEDDCCGAYAGLGIGPLEKHNELCDASYTLGNINAYGNGIPESNGVFKARGTEGENNMGMLTMQLVSFMTNECGWSLHVCDAGNNGFRGQIREQQIKFKAPHPLNLIAPHIMIEMRSVGYIEVNGPDTNGIYGKLDRWFKSKLGARQIQADPAYCNLKYACDAFRKRGSEGENNMGDLTMKLVDLMVKQCAWTMITCNAGNFGRRGDKREQQLVFRNDEHVQHGLDHIMLEFRTSGYIEINGLHDAQDLWPHLEAFLKNTWRCTDYKPYFWEGGEQYCDKKLTCPESFYYRSGLANNLGKLTITLAEFLGQHGWALLLANGGSVTPDLQRPNFIIREQQVKFTRARTRERAVAPLLMLELRTQPTNYSPPSWEGYIEINGPNTNGIYQKIGSFIQEHMRGAPCGRQQYCDFMYRTGVFRLKDAQTNPNRLDGRLNGESNIGKWTMRLCDYMVDHIGEWDLIACNSDNVDWNFRLSKDNTISVTGREMQLIFRHQPKGRGVFMASKQAAPLGRPPLQPPQYWSRQAQQGTVAHNVVPGTAEELAWIQSLLDGTFKKKATRDRDKSEGLADRFVAVQCLRSEHPALWDKFAKRRQEVFQKCKEQPPDPTVKAPKTVQACPQLAERCNYNGDNPTGQAFLMHGTNPTSATAILGTSFKVDFAGKSAGTMFGPGIYLAEASSKADEYARDDAGGEYDGLYAVLLCRAVVGRQLVVQQPGNYAEKVVSGEFDVVIGDREAAVGTYREFIFFHEGSVYPEYAAFYRRERGGEAVPRAVPVAAAPVAAAPVAAAPVAAAPVAAAPVMHAMPGTQYWQFSGSTAADGSVHWHNYDENVAQQLSKARNNGEATLRFDARGQAYEIDFARMVQRNLATGAERRVRC